MSLPRFLGSPEAPTGTNVFGALRPAHIDLLKDITWFDGQGSVCEQEIFDAIEQVIHRAQQYVVLDLFLFNDDYPEGQTYPTLAARVTDMLLARKTATPELPILLITDPINTFYGGHSRSFFEQLRAGGIEVVETNLDALPDSNLAYSAFYRRFPSKWLDGQDGVVRVPNVLQPGGTKVPVSSYLKLLNFKANHRKVVFSESEAVVSSANPHDGSAPNHNLGFRVTGEVVADLFDSERAIYQFSAPDGSFFERISRPTHGIGEATQTQAAVVTESGIRCALLETIRSATIGEKLCVGIFYLSERGVIEALMLAAKRGIEVQIILDKNIDAFGRSKTGIPNLPVSEELASAGAQVRWAATHGEQYHPKFLARLGADSLSLVAGSGNFTRRNIASFNLETSLRVETADSALIKEFTDYWDRYWDNSAGELTQPLSSYKKPTTLQKIVGRIQEKTGLGTF